MRCIHEDTGRAVEHGGEHRMSRTLRVFLGGVNLLDSHGQYSSTHNAEFTMSPYSVSYQQLPLGLLYLAAAQRVLGRTVCDYLMFDFNTAPDETFSLDGVFSTYRAMLQDFRPDVVALGCLTQRQNPYLERAVADARAYAREIKPARIVVGGASATAEPYRFLAAGADVVGLGEGELTFTELIECIAAGGDLESVAGLALPKKTPVLSAGDVHMTPARELIRELDRIPMPAWELLDINTHVRRNRGVFASILTERGCPYACIYCDHSRKFRAHSATRVVDEMQVLVERYGADRIDIVDEIFNCRKSRVLAIRDEKRRRGLNDVRLQDFDGLRADILDEETVDALKDMGFWAFSVAIESATPRIQKLIQKNLKLEHTMQAIEWAVARRIFVNAFFMVGFPTETPDEVYRTLRLARDCNSHQCVVSKVEVYPGTPLWNLAVQNGLDPTGFRSEFIERYGERKDPGFTAMPEADLHAMWERGVFDTYNDPRRMSRIGQLLTSITFRKMYRKFYEEHGIWSAEFGPVFARHVEERDYDGLADAAGRRAARPTLETLRDQSHSRVPARSRLSLPVIPS